MAPNFGDVEPRDAPLAQSPPPPYEPPDWSICQMSRRCCYVKFSFSIACYMDLGLSRSSSDLAHWVLIDTLSKNIGLVFQHSAVLYQTLSWIMKYRSSNLC